MGAPHRRTIYIASLEAHVDRLHAQLLSMGLYPIPFEKLEPYKGLNSKTAKVSHRRGRIPCDLALNSIPEHGSRSAERQCTHETEASRA